LNRVGVGERTLATSKASTRTITTVVNQERDNKKQLAVMMMIARVDVDDLEDLFKA
jgi:hypothetical protein